MVQFIGIAPKAAPPKPDFTGNPPVTITFDSQEQEFLGFLIMNHVEAAKRMSQAGDIHQKAVAKGQAMASLALAGHLAEALEVAKNRERYQASKFRLTPNDAYLAIRYQQEAKVSRGLAETYRFEGITKSALFHELEAAEHYARARAIMGVADE